MNVTDIIFYLFSTVLIGSAAAVVLLRWPNIPVDAAVCARLQNCRALIRKGAGSDRGDPAPSSAANRGGTG